MTTKVIKIDPQNIDQDKIKQAAQVIKKGGIVAFPTETVYGLAADFFNPQAVEKIFRVKQRPNDKPLTVQIADIACLEQLACDVSAWAYQLISRFWPGPLTLIFNRQGGGTIGVRIPDNPVAYSLIKQSQTALVAPSANLSGEPEASTGAEVLETFNGLIDLVIDGGETKLGLASTVVDLSVVPYRILRAGPISQEDIQNVGS